MKKRLLALSMLVGATTISPVRGRGKDPSRATASKVSSAMHKAVKGMLPEGSSVNVDRISEGILEGVTLETLFSDAVFLHLLQDLTKPKPTYNDIHEHLSSINSRHLTNKLLPAEVKAIAERLIELDTALALLSVISVAIIANDAHKQAGDHKQAKVKSAKAATVAVKTATAAVSD